MLRLLIGTILGVALAFTCIMLIELIGGRIYPVSPGTDLTTAANAAQAMATMPTAAKLLVVIGWCVGTAAGSALAAAIAHRTLAVWFVAGFVVAGALSTIAMIPHPGWMIAAGLLLPWLCAWAVKDVAHLRRRH